MFNATFKNISLPDLILIDDDPILTDAWKITAESKGHTLMTFNTISAARVIIQSIPLTTPIYIDSNLSSDEKGEDFSYELYQYGFSNLYLATGYDIEHFKTLPWLKSIVNKHYPK